MQPIAYSRRARNASESVAPTLWRGLVRLTAPCIGRSGRYVFDYSGQSGQSGRHAITSADSAQWTPRGLTFEGSSVRAALGAVSVAPPLTLFARCRPIDSENDAIAIAVGDATSAPWRYIAIYWHGATGRWLIYGVGDTAQNSTAWTDPSRGVWRSVVGVLRSPTEWECWMDGDLVATASFDIGSIELNHAVLGARATPSQTARWKGEMATAGLADRAWSPAEIKQWSTDPLCMLRRRERSSWRPKRKRFTMIAEG